jgi:hypothetical protein
MTLAFFVDLAVIVLLIVTIGYCAAVHRKLSVLRAAQADMRGEIDRFTAATAQAEGQIRSLRTAAEELEKGLGPKVDAARRQADDLDMLIHRGDKLVRRLDELDGPSAAYDSAGAVTNTSIGEEGTRERRSSHAGRSLAEKDLIKALKGHR